MTTPETRPDDGTARSAALRLSRRGARLSITAALAVLLIAIAAVLPVPYVRLSPGPTADTLGAIEGTELIQISGRETYPTEGHLNLTTVSVSGGPDQRLDLLSAFGGWLDGSVAVVPEEAIYPPNVTQEQVREENAEEMELSQQNATVSALRSLDIPVTPGVVVRAIAEGAPSLGKLEAGDVIVAIDGTPVTTPKSVSDAITAHDPGEDVRLEVRRDGTRRTETVTTRAAEDDGRAVIGIEPAVAFEYPFEVKIGLEDVGGPSAGLMFALGIVDKLTPGALTGGSFVAGTGTIDTQGVVGPIGGIQQKLVAAREAGATVFLVPAGNCAEALQGPPEDLRLVRVASLDEAVASLDALRTGEGAVSSCGS